jgi:hypothetical protein
MTIFKTRLGWEPLAAALILSCVGLNWASLPKPADAAAYHRAIRQAAASIPMRIGDWVGSDAAVPGTAVTMLRPNVILSRRYVNVASGLEVSVLLVQCADARDIVAHYPPVCLINAGWKMTDARPHDWTAGGMEIAGTEYQFVMPAFDKLQAIVVSNFMVLPDGRFVRDMGPVAEAAADVAHRYFGAGQVQVVTPADLAGERREKVVTELIGAMCNTIAAIRAGAAG